VPSSHTALRPPPRSTWPPSGSWARRRIGGREHLGGDRGHPGAGAALGEKLGGEALEELRLLAELGAGLGDVLLRRGIELSQHREHVLPDPVARELRVEVGRVVAEGKPGLARQRARLLAAEGQQRPDHPPAPRRQSEQRAAPRRNGEAIDQRLRGVGHRVTGRDPVGVASLALSLGGLVARGARLGLEVSALDLGALDPQVDAKRRAELPAGALVVVGGDAQPVVEMQRVDVGPSAVLDERRGSAGGVGPAGDQDHGAVEPIDEPALADDLPQLRKRLLLAHRGDLTRRTGGSVSAISAAGARRRAPSLRRSP
jgi:hypothetical protein